MSTGNSVAGERWEIWVVMVVLMVGLTGILLRSVLLESTPLLQHFLYIKNVLPSFKLLQWETSHRRVFGTPRGILPNLGIWNYLCHCMNRVARMARGVPDVPGTVKQPLKLTYRQSSVKLSTEMAAFCTTLTQ